MPKISHENFQSRNVMLSMTSSSQRYLFDIICLCWFGLSAKFKLLISQSSNMSVKCGPGRSWKPKVKLNLCCHCNIATGMSYISFLFHLSTPRIDSVMAVLKSMSPGNPNPATLTFDPRSWKHCLEILCSHVQPWNMITIFENIPKTFVYQPGMNPAMVSSLRFYDRNELYGSPDLRNCRMPNFTFWIFFCY